MQKTIRFGPNWTLVLDSSEVFPDDPGAGTPAMVYGPKRYQATYWFALNEGLLWWNGSGGNHGDSEGDLLIPVVVLKWLDSMLPEVEKVWLVGEKEYRERKALV